MQAAILMEASSQEKKWREKVKVQISPGETGSSKRSSTASISKEVVMYELSEQELFDCRSSCGGAKHFPLPDDFVLVFFGNIYNKDQLDMFSLFSLMFNV